MRTSGAREDVVNFFDGKDLGSAKRAVDQVSNFRRSCDALCVDFFLSVQ
jgi:hypothetical protein